METGRWKGYRRGQMWGRERVKGKIDMRIEREGKRDGQLERRADKQRRCCEERTGERREIDMK